MAFLLALISLFAPADRPPPASPGAPIVFAAIPDPTPGRGPQCGNAGDPELYTVAPDGTGLHRLTDNRLHESTPAWSPDHRLVVFAARLPMSRDRTLDDDLFVMRSDGTHVRRLTRGPGQDWRPAWSPDGKRIAFVRRLPRRPGVSSSDDKRAGMIVGVDGTGLRRLGRARSHAGDLSPAWSPGGDRIAFARQSGRLSGLTIARPGRRGRAIVTDRKAELSVPSWSPDGRWIAYTASEANRRVERVRIDGSGRATLTEELWVDAHSPAWSPRGDRIAYVGTDDGCHPHVHRMTARGHRHVDLLEGRDLEVYSLDW